MFQLNSDLPPLLILTGFLGAGKTTALRRVLPVLVAANYRPAVILNDVQNAKLDASTLQGLADLVQPVDGACVCCDDPQALISALEDLPQDDRLVVLLEANGATDVNQLLELVSSVPSLRRFAPPRLIGVVDGRRWQKRHWHNALEAAQLKPASVLWLNRIEEMSAQQVVDLENGLRQCNSRAQLLPPERWIEVLRAPQQVTKGSSTISHNTPTEVHQLAHTFSALTLEIPDGTSRSTINTWLETLPPQVLRVKGILTDPDGIWFFQRTDTGFAGWEKLEHPLSVNQMAVLIGPGLDAQQIKIF